ncbi:MAG TPA: 1,2-phenylacetyl-CoA epoxidase subunit PaaD [Anaerolineae bacterium]|jgi:ring-1,2-phenylacetyl-CoA epoxidase subunit PaaD|nr:1,2-phenylacetyl-CoA epoxidase subunit PaaD [Anaerolineae bacterium]
MVMAQNASGSAASGSVTAEAIWSALQEVKDPEIPVISVVEMGIVRDVTVSPAGVIVKMTPTFSGCPALDVMRTDIESKIRELGVQQVQVNLVLHPPWSSDWIDETGRQKLKHFGLAPPPRHGGRLEVTFYESVPCPRCDSPNTIVRNTFGPTLCRAMYTCNNCQEPFEQFKPL